MPRSGHLKPCDSYFLIADYQVSDYAADIAHVRESVWKVALGWLAVGLDPGTELLLHRKAKWVRMPRRNPTLKAEMEDLGRKSVPVAFFTYPVMQGGEYSSAPRPSRPGRAGQLPHIEFTLGNNKDPRRMPVEQERDSSLEHIDEGRPRVSVSRNSTWGNIHEIEYSR